mgnify:CR=1 FL=1
MGNGAFSLLKKPRQSTGPGQSAQIRALIVEPDNASARALKRAIRRNPAFACELDRVRRLRDAGERLTECAYDLVLISPAEYDVAEGMPRQLRSRNLGCDVLVLPLPPGPPPSSGGRYQLDLDWLSQVLRYVTQRKQLEAFLRATEDALCEEKERRRVVLDAIDDAVLLSDPEGRVTHMNPVAEKLTGWNRMEAAGRPVEEVVNFVASTAGKSPDHPLLCGIREDRALAPEVDTMLVRRNGEELRIEESVVPIHNRDGEVISAALVFRDLRHSIEMTQKLAHMAHHDELTGLPNRTLLDERLEQAISLAKRHNNQTALLFLDLDGLKAINDSCGHLFGDRVLQLVADKLRRSVRETDTVYRQGGDEFVILLTEIEQPEDAAQVAEKILAEFAAPLVLDGQSMQLKVSIGISVFPDDGDSAETILRQADAAMYFSKLNEHVDYGFARGDLNQWFKSAQTMEHRLFKAFEAGEFVLHYQPQVALVSGEICGVEALVRWDDPDQGLIYPAEFMPAAERSGLMVAIGRWVVYRACQQAAAWRDEGRKLLPVAINISAPEFEHPHFVTFVREVLRETQVAPDKLELEFSEGVLMRDPERSMVRLQQLRDMGLRLALDDFGSEGSSLRYLRHFPVDSLKIDQSLMSDVTGDPSTSVVLRSLVDMGKGLKRCLVAEGVETANQLGFVQAQLFDGAQGYRFAPPQDAEGFSKLLDKQQ